MSEMYKLGNAVFEPDMFGHYRWRTFQGDVVADKEELLEMGAQLIEEEKPQEINCPLETFYIGFDEDTESSIKPTTALIEWAEKITKAVNTHLSACGKEKHI